MVASRRLSAAAERAARWHRALDRWSGAIELRLPKETRRKGVIGCIDLQTRQTLINFRRLRKLGLVHCEEALFAHEIGHHIRYPHTLVRARQHTRFLRSELAELALAWGLPSLGQAAREGRCDSLLNLLYDLLINTDLRPHYEAEFIALYTALSGEGEDPIFGFYLALYEALWYLPDGALVGPAHRAALDAADPGWRSSAAACAQFIANRPDNRCLQLVRFLVALRPFFAAGARSSPEASPEGDSGFGGQMDPADTARVLRPLPGEAEARSWRKGQAPKSGLGAHSGGSQPGGSAGAPGQSQGDPVRDAQAVLAGLCDQTAVALATYRRLADKTPLEVPPSHEPGLPEVPGLPVEWHLGDRVSSIDWFTTLTRSGVAIPGVTIQKRTWMPAEAVPGHREVPWVELYVDSSGSMPDPVKALNHAILAGFILVDAATRAGGRVRVVQYSHRFEAMPDFVASPRLARAALLGYVGGGTRYPWEELHRSVGKWGRRAHIARVVISDSDFCYNVRRPPDEAVRDAALDGACRTGRLIALLDGGDAQTLRELGQRGVEVVPTRGMDQIPALARALAEALFPPDGS